VGGSTEKGRAAFGALETTAARLLKVRLLNRNQPLSRGGKGFCSCRGFRMTAHNEPSHAHRGRRPKAFRERTRGMSGTAVPGLYGDFDSAVEATAADDAAAGRLRLQTVVTMRPKWPEDKGGRPIWALQEVGLDERCRGRPRAPRGRSG